MLVIILIYHHCHHRYASVFPYYRTCLLSHEDYCRQLLNSTQQRIMDAGV